MMIELIAAVLVLIGAVFIFVGSLAMFRFPDFMTRLHGPTKTSTLGLISLLAGLMVYSVGTDAGLTVREFLITVFLFVTAPVSGHLMARSAIHRRLRSIAPPPAPLQEREIERE
jgi:multicomponent K+:H+ antiporter subunit G